MGGLTPGTAVDALQLLHETLATHFRQLHVARSCLDPAAPVYALEHDLSSTDIDLLKASVRAAVQAGLGARYRQSWLPFVVYAAESGYDYLGPEYWRSFEESTAGWRSDHRHWIKTWYEKFATEYGGAVPTGAFATSFTIIAWPITHAVLPTYLQRQLAQLLFEFSGALTSQLLDDPSALGKRLARRASNYTERFRIFCQNTTLIGQVAIALLSGENDPTPYLSSATLTRIVESLSAEQQARTWLKSAQQSATLVRGFLADDVDEATEELTKTLPRATNPRLFLRYGVTWKAFAELPDLTTLGADHPDVYGQLRKSRASVSGGAQPVMPSALLYPGQEVSFARWPDPDKPFVQLDRGDERTNAILADQCIITRGPLWLFRCQGSGLAIEIKGKFVRPGHRYIMVEVGTLSRPAVPWATMAQLEVEGARAHEFTVPRQIDERDEAALRAVGLGVVSHVAIRPVGLVASAWDGEGEVEWLAGEPAMLGIRSDLLPTRCRVVVNGSIYSLAWSPDETELLFALKGLPVGTHHLTATLLGDEDRQLASGALVIMIRDPQVRPEGASVGEGIRLLATPARPTMSELWDERALVMILGPLGTSAEMRVVLRNGQGKSLVELRRTIQLPLEEAGWRVTAKTLRTDPGFKSAYDAAEACSVTVVRDGVGFAALNCERGFQPLRWRFIHTHGGDVLAMLIDRTDGGNTAVEFYDVESPMTPVPKDPSQQFKVPPRGGLVIARAGEAIAAALAPTNPNAIFHTYARRPVVNSRTQSSTEVLRLIEGHRNWIDADLPGDPFVAHGLQMVDNEIARAIGTLIGGSHWAAIERKMLGAQEPADHLDDMQGAVGQSTQHKKIASTIAYSLFKWLDPEDLLLEFHELINPLLADSGIRGVPAAPRFLLMLAGRPGSVADWDADEAKYILRRVLTSPVLYRAARFAVLGTRALNDAESLDRGF